MKCNLTVRNSWRSDVFSMNRNVICFRATGHSSNYLENVWEIRESKVLHSKRNIIFETSSSSHRRIIWPKYSASTSLSCKFVVSWNWDLTVNSLELLEYECMFRFRWFVNSFIKSRFCQKYFEYMRSSFDLSLQCQVFWSLETQVGPP